MQRKLAPEALYEAGTWDRYSRQEPEVDPKEIARRIKMPENQERFKKIMEELNYQETLS